MTFRTLEPLEPLLQAASVSTAAPTNGADKVSFIVVPLRRQTSHRQRFAKAYQSLPIPDAICLDRDI